MNDNFNPEIEIEYGNMCKFIKEKYEVDIESKDELITFTKTSLEFLISIKIWSKYIKQDNQVFADAKNYFYEIVSNIINSIILAVLDLKVPALIMFRRSQENILTFLYYSEHPIEYYKKERDGNSKSLNGFKELKEYVTTYPFSCKYNISDQIVQSFASEILKKWTEQYQELSNFVHGTNTKYFEGIEYFDQFTYDKRNITYLTEQIEKLSSIINSILITFYFNQYKLFSEETEKSIIRKSIKNKYEFKNEIIKIFKEI